MTAHLPSRQYRRYGPWGQLALHGSLAFGAVFILAPFVLMVLTSFKFESDVFAPGLLPPTWTLETYRTVLDRLDLLHYYRNGVIVTASILLLQLAVCVPAGFALARLRFRGSGLGLWTVLLCLMIPGQVVAIPVYLLLNQFGLLNSHAALILPFVGSAFGIFLFRQFFLTMPQEVVDAARLDGASTFALVWRVAAPLARPAIVAFGIFSVVNHWNSFFWPFFVLTDDTAATVPWALATFTFDNNRIYAAEQAASVLGVLPMFIGFVLASRSIVEGVALSGGQH
ncbi:MAG: carbohydrate ABC transporter permease [Nitriliruptoraceae bacterium]